MTAATVPEFSPDPAYTLQAPRDPRPIVVIGAGGIVHDAHLPAYAKAGFPVFGLADVDAQRAGALAEAFGIRRTFRSAAEAAAAAPPEAVFDVAVPPAHILEVLAELPDESPVQIQKPLGDSPQSTRAILDLCHRKGLTAAVNTQLRFAPYIAAARTAIAHEEIGELYDIEVQVEVNTPWQMFPYVAQMDRLELHMHSIHYLDLVRSFVGDPAGVSCLTVRHPRKELANTRTAVLMHYPDRQLRALVATNHDHHFGPRHEQSFVKWEGTAGAIWAQLGALMAYPNGREDRLEIYRDADPSAGWQPIRFQGTWFPDAFIGSMGALMRYLEGSLTSLPTSIDDVAHTMAVVEAAYHAAADGGTAPSYI